MDAVVFFFALLISIYTVLNFIARIAVYMNPNTTQGFSLTIVNIEVVASTILWTVLYVLLH